MCVCVCVKLDTGLFSSKDVFISHTPAKPRLEDFVVLRVNNRSVQVALGQFFLLSCDKKPPLRMWWTGPVTNTQPGFDREGLVVPVETNEATVCSIQLGLNLRSLRAAIVSKSDVANGCLFGALERHRKWLLVSLRRTSQGSH